MRNGTITIKDIARELSISCSTVSRALANSELVKSETKKAVKDLAVKYNYIPSFTALSLLKSKTYTVGVIVPNLVHEFFAKVIRGIEDHLMKHSYNIILCPTHDSYPREVEQLKTLMNGRVDALIACITRETENFDHFQGARDRNIPVVFFDSSSSSFDVPNVVLNDYQAGYDAVKHLIQRGCKRIAYLGGPEQISVNRERFRAYMSALQDHNLDPDERIIRHGSSDDADAGQEHTAEMLNSGASMDGLFAGTDLLAVGAIKSIKKAGLSVPKDIAVIGFSNWQICELYEPSISSMAQPGFEMGTKAAEIAIAQINQTHNETDYRVMIESQLIVRESSSR